MFLKICFRSLAICGTDKSRNHTQRAHILVAITLNSVGLAPTDLRVIVYGYARICTSAFNGTNYFSRMYVEMAYVRRYKKRAPMRKRTGRSYMARRKTYIRRKAKVNHLTTQRWLQFIVFNGNDTIPNGGVGQFFKLSDLPNSSEFTALFDQYMIAGVKYRFVSRINPDFNSTSSVKGVYPVIKWVHDHDDANAPSAREDLQQYPGCREFNFSSDKNCTRWMYLKPAIANEVFGTTLTTAYQPKWRQWCDNAYPGIQHYGLKMFVDSCYAGQTIYLECKYVLKLKGVV